jgi:hypothetical protein
MVKYLKDHGNNHIVEQKKIKTKILSDYKTNHIVTLKYYPEETENEFGETIVVKPAEWWVEIDVCGCFNEMYNNEKHARLSYDLIDRQFCINIENWHLLRNNTDDFRMKFMKLHKLQIFEGKK